MNDLTLTGGSPFDSIRRVREDGSEYWSGRDLMPLMDYGQWVKFVAVIEKARDALALIEGAAQAKHHFPKRETDGGRWGNQQIDDYELTRLGAYLTAMAGDDTKRAVAEARIYFAVNTRKQEIAEQQQRFEIPQSFAEALELAARQAREIEAVQAKVAELEPAAQAWDELVDTGATLDVAAAAKKLTENGIPTGRTRLYDYMRDIGWVFKLSTQPKQSAVDAGWVTVDWGKKFTNLKTGEEGQGAAKTRVTPKGLTELQRRLTVPRIGPVAS